MPAARQLIQMQANVYLSVIIPMESRKIKLEMTLYSINTDEYEYTQIVMFIRSGTNFPEYSKL